MQALTGCGDDTRSVAGHAALAILPLIVGPLIVGCASASSSGADDGSTGEPDASAPIEPWSVGPPLGARRHRNGDLEFRVVAPHAERLEVALFDVAIGAEEVLRVPLENSSGQFSLRISREELASVGTPTEIQFYGYRAFGPNWQYDGNWRPGSEDGFIAEVDGDGHRMNPNKLLLDPYALEVSHDPTNPAHRDFSVFRSDTENRLKDSGPFAPKGVIIEMSPDVPAGPKRSLRHDVVYEVHLRGLTMADPDVPEELRGTYAGAAYKATYLAELGITAVEFLPLHETVNDQNDIEVGASGDNYWGYVSQSFFAPDRRYAADKSPGGPTRELREMVAAFHAEGIKVYNDVVYNHYSEGSGSTILSLRGLDNATYYTLADDPNHYINSNGVSANVNTANPVVGDLVVESLRYWHAQLGFDGYRFDLASVIGNRCERGCFEFSDQGLLSRIADEFARNESGEGVDLIAEPWGVAPGTYQVGNFPPGWSDWNDQYRDVIRRDLNKLGVEDVRPRDLANRLAGSPDLFGNRGPAFSLNFVNAHDGFTLRDLFSYDSKQNGQPWPHGPSDGGSNNEHSYSHGGSDEGQRSAARTAMALLMLSAGVPMITGGDEFLRTQRGNNNPYNIDSSGTWLDWQSAERDEDFLEFMRALLGYRNRHIAFRPQFHWNASGESDRDGDGRPEIRWLTDNGNAASDAYLDSANLHFLAYELDGDDLGDEASAILVGYNGWSSGVTFHLPPPPEGMTWRLVGDTSAAGSDWGHWLSSPPEAAAGATYAVGARSLVAFEASANPPRGSQRR